jgi:hypothetical protein
MNLVWILTVGFLAVLAEILLGNCGLAVPLLGLCLFYFAGVFGWWRLLVPACILAALLDAALGRKIPLAVLDLLPVLSLAMFWRWHGDCRHPLAQTLPGFALGVFFVGQDLARHAWLPGGASYAVAWPAALIHAFTLLGGFMVGLPLLCHGLDFLAARMKLPLYGEAQQEESDTHGV